MSGTGIRFAGCSTRCREWFLVPLYAIDDAVEKIKEGTISNYNYAPRAARLEKIGQSEFFLHWINQLLHRQPDRIRSVDEKAVAILKQRTLTDPYNERLSWLANAYEKLDEAIASAFGWLSEDHGHQGLLRGLARLEEGREVAALAQLGYAQLQAAEACVQGPVPVAIAIGRALAGAFVPASADQPFHVGLHQQLHHGLGHRAQEVAIAGFGQQLGQR